MPRIVFSRDIQDDVFRILTHLGKYQVANPDERIREIIQAIQVLSVNPLIGRTVQRMERELVIGRDHRGYLALYEFDEFEDIVYVLSIRSQREAGYAESSSSNK